MTHQYKIIKTIFIGMLIFAAAGIASSQTLFSAPHAYDGGAGYATKDINNDGKLDIVAAKSDRINLLRGNGDGTFQPSATPVFTCAGYSSTALRQPLLGDFDGDNRQDIVAWVEDAACTSIGTRALMLLKGNGSGGFSAPVFLSVSNFFFSPSQFASADFNGDGKLDVVVSSAYSSTDGDRVGIFLNNGNGVFSQPATYNFGVTMTYTMTIGDFNNDSRPDIVCARFAPAELRIMSNNGDGTFAAPQTISTNIPIGVMTTGDFNRDGRLDLAVITYINSTPTLQILLGNGNNTFQQGGSFPLSTGNSGVSSILQSDFNNDGNSDLGLALNNRTLILKGNGTGGFAQDELYGIGGGSLLGGDFNNDGWTDITTKIILGSNGSATGGASEFAVLTNLQNGKFLTAPIAEIPYGGDELAIADFDNDGLKDIALTGDAGEGEFAVILQENDLSSKRTGKKFNFASNEKFSAGLGPLVPQTIAAGDFNRDGKKDVVVAGRPVSGTGLNVIIAKNEGAGNFSLSTTLTVNGSITKVITADLNGDNILDLAFSVVRDTGSPNIIPAVVVSLGNANGTFAAPVGYMSVMNVFGYGIAHGDFNGDNRPDLAVIRNDYKVTVLLNNGNGTFTEGATYDAPGIPTKILTADMNGDGKQDLVIAGNSTNTADSAKIGIYNGNGNGTFLPPVNFPTVWLYNQKFVINDFNGDGKPDVATSNNSVVAVLENDGSGNLVRKTLWASSGALQDIAADDLDGDNKPDIVTSSAIQNFRNIAFLPNISVRQTRHIPYDFDGDGKSDIGIFRPSTGAWWITRSSTDVTFAAAFGSSTDKITPADFTGDGKADLAFFRPSTGTWFILRSEDFSFYGFPFGAEGDVPVAADFDGDGKADPAVFRASTAAWYIQKSSGGVESVTFGTNGDAPVVADYDGDGKADIAITRINGTNREWWIRRSSDGQVLAAAFGGANDKAVQGDYTGDGKADIAFFRPVNGYWYIIRSEDFSFYGFPFGMSIDIPTPGDYDGDGKFDVGVFRPSNNGWYQQRTTQGFTAVTFGTSGDIPVPSAYVP